MALGPIRLAAICRAHIARSSHIARSFIAINPIILRSSHRSGPVPSPWHIDSYPSSAYSCGGRTSNIFQRDSTPNVPRRRVHVTDWSKDPARQIQYLKTVPQGDEARAWRWGRDPDSTPNIPVWGEQELNVTDWSRYIKHSHKDGASKWLNARGWDLRCNT